MENVTDVDRLNLKFRCAKELVVVWWLLFEKRKALVKQLNSAMLKLDELVATRLVQK